MKTILKTSYLFVAFAFFLTSCNQEAIPGSTPDVEDRRVVFYTSLPDITTKAAISEDLEFFFVTVFNESDDRFRNEKEGKLNEYVDSLKVQEDVLGSKRFISYNCLWPDLKHERDTLHFLAYNPVLPSGASLFNNTSVNGEKVSIGYKVNGYSIATDIADQVDFVTAYATGSLSDNYTAGINLKFKHQLSRVEVMAKSSSKSYKLEIAGVRIGGMHTEGTYNFKAEEISGNWTIDETQDKEIVEYIYRPGDKIVALNNTTDSVSIMGGSNYAMLLPHKYETSWDFANDHTNSNKGMFISVLLRLLDKTPGGNDKQQYPYFDNSQGLNAMNIPREYFAVAKTTGIISNRLYKSGNSYYTDKECTKSYTLASGEEVREFGWAALPVTGNWQSGYSYTYTLDYTYGVGLHDPSVEDPTSGLDSAYPGPMAGDPIISERVGVSVSVNDWQGLNGSTTHKIEVPGS